MPTFLCSNAAFYVDANSKYKAARYFFTVKGSSLKVTGSLENLTYPEMLIFSLDDCWQSLQVEHKVYSTYHTISQIQHNNK